MEQTEPFVAIVNPAAGGGRCGQRAPAAIDALRQTGLQIEVIETQQQGDGSLRAREAYARGVRRFIAVGGDGTSYEIVNGLFPEALSDSPPSLGFLPLGTGNSFLRDFSEQGAEHARAALEAQHKRRCDVVRLSHRDGEIYYINILSLGFVADVCTQANRRFKRFGEAAYGLGVAVEVAGLSARSLPMRCDGGPPWNDASVFVSFSNSRFTGGKMMMAPEADATDGELDVVFVGEMGRLNLLRTFPKIFTGEHVRHEAVRTCRAQRVDFELAGPTDAMIDGEVVTVWPERLEVLHGALEVYA